MFFLPGRRPKPDGGQDFGTRTEQNAALRDCSPQRGVRIADRPDHGVFADPPCDSTGNVLYSKSRWTPVFRLWRVGVHPKQGSRVFPHPDPVRGILFLCQASACGRWTGPAVVPVLFVL